MIAYPFAVRPWFVLAALGAPLLSFADRIDDLVGKDLERFKIPGISLAIVQDGKVVKRAAYGVADLELKAPATPDDLYEIGSMTKQFTAMATLMLVEEGKVGLEDPISKYIPEAPKTWDGIKIRNLLNQNSGLPEYVLLPGTMLTDEFDRAKWMKNVTPLPLDFAPGTAWAYSNTNFALLGWVIEKASGKPYVEFVTERILKAAGMDHARFQNVTDVIPRRSHGYYPLPDGNLLRMAGMNSGVQSDGTLMCTLDDLVKWDTALRERKLVKPESYRLLWEPGKLASGRTRPYGMGWMLEAPGGVPIVYHPGASVGYSACISRYGGDKLTVIVLTNLYSSFPELIAKHVAEATDPAFVPVVPKVVSDPDPARTAKVRAALEALAAGKLTTEYAEPELIGPLNTPRAKMGGPVYRDFAKIASFDYAGETKQGDDTLLVYRLKNDRRALTLYLLWSKEGKVAQTYLRPDPSA